MNKVGNQEVLSQLTRIYYDLVSQNLGPLSTTPPSPRAPPAGLLPPLQLPGPGHCQAGYCHSELCYGNIMKNYFFSQNVLPHNQTVTIIKAEIYSNASLRNKYIRCFGEDLGKLSCLKYQRSGRNCPFPESHQKKGSVSLFRDQYHCH